LFNERYLIGAGEMKSSYGLIGAGGYGREVMPVVRQMLSRDIERGLADLYFIEMGEVDQTTVNGYPVISLEGFLQLPGEKRFNIAIADATARERIAARAKSSGLQPFSVIALNSVIMDANTIGEGCILSPFTTITSNARIGSFFHANIYSYVAHDCVIGDFVTFAPGVKCNGHVHVEDHAYVGTGAVMKQGTKDAPLVIGKSAIVGMGSVVTKGVPPGITVVGNPARPFGAK
jgi:sugar O-acyltransferase (sialic acid O-acetyltransferase NeuD family)